MRLNEVKDRSVADLKLEYCGDLDFNCGGEELTSLAGSPRVITYNFCCNDNKLTSLIGGPIEVGEDVRCYNNELTTLTGAPSVIGKPSSVISYFHCQNNRLTSLKDVHKHIKQLHGKFYATGNPINSHVLGLLLIKGLRSVQIDNFNVQEILNRHLPSSGMKDVLEAQEELIDAGFGEFAEL